MKPYYSSGNVTIYHGDSREIVPELPRVNLVITDPPYAIGAGQGEWAATAAVAIALNESAKKIRKTGSMLVFTTTSGRGIEFTQGAIGRTLPFNRLLVWHKTGGRSRAMSPWRWDAVAILLFGRAPTSKSGASSVFACPADYERETDHRAELPDGIDEWLLNPFWLQVEATLDPFLGTGRLLDPLVATGRKAIGIEIEERHCETAAKRFEVIRTSTLQVDPVVDSVAKPMW